MHQTFYIDIDEEITSIVDRLRKAKATEVVLVIPKRALLIQSIVNLKLLKKEAENLGIQIMIVTQDKLGRFLIEKAGILVQNKLDEALEEEVILENDEEEIKEKKEIKEKTQSKKEKERVKNIGSDDYFSSQKKKDSFEKNEVYLENKDEEKDFEKITNKELVTHVGKNLRKKSFFKNKKAKMVDLSNISNVDISVDKPKEKEEPSKEAPKKKDRPSSRDNRNNIQKLANFFQSGQKNELKKEDSLVSQKIITERPFEKRKKDPEVHISGKFWKIFLIFGFLALITFALVGAYLFLPKVEIKIYPKIKTTSEDFQIKGMDNMSGVNLESQEVPIKEVEAEEEYIQEFSSTGEEGISNQKARGTITIYNEYSSSPQQLVATTRFLTEDEKLFRLVSGVTIPGMATENGEKKPGSVEAQVVADESGSEYNIGPARFSIPGFKSSGEEKHSKFYAVSTELMTGGGDGGEKVKTVTQEDIDRAKVVIEKTFKERERTALQEAAGSGWVILEEAVVDGDPQYIISNSPGEAAEKFSLTIKVKRKALTFTQENIKKVVANKIARENDGYEIESEDITLDFGKADADWENKTMTIRLQATVDMGASLDLENIKNGILGKNEEEMKSFLETYSEIKKIDVDYWPFFITGKIPMYESRVTVTLDKD